MENHGRPPFSVAQPKDSEANNKKLETTCKSYIVTRSKSRQDERMLEILQEATIMQTYHFFSKRQVESLDLVTAT